MVVSTRQRLSVCLHAAVARQRRTVAAVLGPWCQWDTSLPGCLLAWRGAGCRGVRVADLLVVCALVCCVLVVWLLLVVSPCCEFWLVALGSVAAERKTASGGTTRGPVNDGGAQLSGNGLLEGANKHAIALCGPM